jgi:hypothetical protein
VQSTPSTNVNLIDDIFGGSNNISTSTSTGTNKQTTNIDGKIVFIQDIFSTSSQPVKANPVNTQINTNLFDFTTQQTVQSSQQTVQSSQHKVDTSQLLKGKAIIIIDMYSTGKPQQPNNNIQGQFNFQNYPQTNNQFNQPNMFPNNFNNQYGQPTNNPYNQGNFNNQFNQQNFNFQQPNNNQYNNFTPSNVNTDFSKITLNYQKGTTVTTQSKVSNDDEFKEVVEESYSNNNAKGLNNLLDPKLVNLGDLKCNFLFNF